MIPDSAIAPPRRVLIVDDDAHAREALRSLLEDEGYDVRTAADGIAALAQLSHFCADIVVADVRMPRMDGAALYDALRAWPGVRPKLIFVSAGPPPDGSMPYLEKPIDFEQLLALLK
jgi:CheY-like chemotaxis protein